MAWRSPCPEVNRVFIITLSEQVECILLTLFLRIKDDFFLLLTEIFHRSLTNPNLEALDKLFELSPLRQTFLIWCFLFWQILLLQPFFQTVKLSFWANIVVLQYMRMRESVNIWFLFFYFLICFVWNRKVLFISSLNWASNCSGQWWRTSFLMGTGNTTLSYNTGTSLKYHLILHWCTLIIT